MDAAAGRFRDRIPAWLPPRVAIVLLWAQVVIVAGFVVFFIVEFVLGQASDPAAVFTSVLIFLLGIVGLTLLARGWMAGRTWPRTPTMVWHGLLLPIGWSLAETHHDLIAAAVLAAGLAGIAAAVLSPAEAAQHDTARHDGTSPLDESDRPETA